MGSLYFEINEEENAVDYLEKAAQFYSSSDPNKLKWLVISLHGALYGFAVCAIQASNPGRVMDGERLISLWEALKRCEDDVYMLYRADSTTLNMTDQEKAAIEKLSKDSRNRFEHFTPAHWFIEVSGMPQIVSHVSRVVRFLALESGNVKLTGEQHERAERALKVLTQ